MATSLRRQLEEKYLDTYWKRLVFVIFCLAIVVLYLAWQIIESSGPRARRSALDPPRPVAAAVARETQEALFDRDALREVARLIDVGTAA